MMKKQNLFVGGAVNSLFEGGASANGSCFRVNGGSTSTAFEIPTILMHRLFRLGQAHGIRQLRYFESGVKIVVGTVELPEFAADLHRLRILINDAELHPYLDRLLAELEAPPGVTTRSVAVSCGDYFKRDAIDQMGQSRFE
jgi:hypothetical protein